MNLYTYIYIYIYVYVICISYIYIHFQIFLYLLFCINRNIFAHFYKYYKHNFTFISVLFM
jgi:hypothetical protein